jgi:transposase
MTDDSFSFARKEAQMAEETALDGFYVIRASAAHTQAAPAEELVRSYKDLKFNEPGFRSLKTADLEARPISHWTEARVRAHFFRLHAGALRGLAPEEGLGTNMFF